MGRASGLLRLSAWLRARLAPLAAAALAAGLLFGSRYRIPHPELFIEIAIFLMIYPMLLGVAPADLGRTLGSGRAVAGSLLINYGASPLLALGLALLFLRGEAAEFSAGLVLLGLVPCGNMSAVYAGLGGGNVALALGVVAVSYLADLPLVPLLSKLYVGRFIHVPLATMAGYLFWLLVLPLLAAAVTRRLLVARAGPEGLERVAAEGAGLSVVGLAAVIFVICSVRAAEILARPALFLKLCLPVPLLLGGLGTLAAVWSRLAGLAYEEAVTLVVTSGTKNVALALALATLTFGPLAALPIILAGPFLQVPLVLLFVRAAPRLRPLLEGTR